MGVGYCERVRVGGIPGHSDSKVALVLLVVCFVFVFLKVRTDLLLVLFKADNMQLSKYLFGMRLCA